MNSCYAKKEVVTMAHTVQNKAEQTDSNIFSTLEFNSCNTAKCHLKPLSVYATMTFNQETTVHHQRKHSNQCINFKVDNSAQKRELENSSCDDGYETPSKKFIFDCDVDDILCLNPIVTNAPGEVSDSTRSCQNPISCTFQNKQLTIPTGKCGEKLERNEALNKGQENLRESLNVKDEQEDKGYFSMSCTKELKQLPTATPSPQPKPGEHKVLQHECRPEGSSKLLDSVKSPVESLEGDVEDTWNIGPPIFESSLCCTDTVKVHAGTERSGWLEELQEHGIEPTSERHTTEETTVDTSYESTLPLQVQVKSVVVVPRQHTTTNCPDSAHLSNRDRAAKPNPEEKKCKRCVSPKSQRPAVFNRELDWEHDKERYIHLVKKHMNDNRVAGQDVMTELVNLMSNVADQPPGSGRQWQHPSDLTRRNHQRRFGSAAPKVSLKEWQAKNCTTFKRFAKVPKIFERSQLP